jgi:hypothetical protein
MSETPSSLGRRRARAVLARTGRGTCSPGADVDMGSAHFQYRCGRKKGVHQGAAGRRLRTGQAMRRPTPRLIAGDQRAQWVTLRPVGSVALTTNSASRARSSARTSPLSRLPCGRRFLGEFCSMHGIRADNAAPRMAWLRTIRHDDTKLNETKGVQNGAPVDVAPRRRSPYRRGGLRGLSPAEGGAERVWGRTRASECHSAQGSVTAQWQSEPPKRHCGFGQTFASLISASRAKTKLTGHSWRRVPGHRDACAPL